MFNDIIEDEEKKAKITKDKIEKTERDLKLKAIQDDIDRHAKLKAIREEADFREMVHNLIRFESDISSIEWKRLLEEDYIAILIESELNLDLATEFVEKMIRIAHKVDKFKKKILPRTIRLYTLAVKHMRDDIADVHIKMMQIDTLGLGMDVSLVEAVRNRVHYRGSVIPLPSVASESKKRMEEIKESVSYEQILLDIGNMKDVLMQSIMGIRIEKVEGEVDEFGHQKYIKEMIERDIKSIPMYFKMVEELKTHAYSVSNKKASAKDYLANQLKLDERIKAQTIEMKDRARLLKLDNG